MKKALTNCAPGSGRHETYGLTLKLSLEANKSMSKGPQRSFVADSLGQGPFCRLAEFSRFLICLGVLRPWDMGGT